MWQRAVSRLLRGEQHPHRFAKLGATPLRLQSVGLGAADMVMSAAKIVRAAREHPDVPEEVWLRLPRLLESAIAAFPSIRGDGSVVAVIVERDGRGHPIVVPIQWDENQKLNVILSVYGRSPNDRLSGDEWIANQLSNAKRSGLKFFGEVSSVDAKPEPEPAFDKNATSWSPGSIPVDRSTEPRRKILTLPSKVKPDDG